MSFLYHTRNTITKHCQRIIANVSKRINVRVKHVPNTAWTRPNKSPVWTQPDISSIWTQPFELLRLLLFEKLLRIVHPFEHIRLQSLEKLIR